jgi:hypothetical protein
LNDNYSWLYLLTGLGAIGVSRQPEGVIGDLIARLGSGGSGFGGLRRSRTPLGAGSARVAMTPAAVDAER